MDKNTTNIFGEEVDLIGIKTPYQLYRRMRPYYFSDSKKIQNMSREQFDYYMSQLSKDKKQDLFEEFTRQLIVRLITPNIIPQTGPIGGGDGGTDLESYPVSDDISDKWYLIDTCKCKDRWAFAISCKSEWKPKMKDDVKKIVEKNRDFTKIFFCTNQKVPSKDRAELFDWGKAQHKIDLEILDYNWYEQSVFENGCYQIAINTLRIDGLEEKIEEGPLDKERKKELKEIDERISVAQQEKAVNTDYVEDLLRAAILTRELEESPIIIKGRFNQALTEAKKLGSPQQEFNILYQMAWTEFYWFENPDQMISHYADLKKMLRVEINPTRIEKAYNLRNLERTAIAAKLFKQVPDTKEDNIFWKELYDKLKDDNSHQSSFLYLHIVRLEEMLIESIHKNEGIDEKLRELQSALRKSTQHIDVPFESHLTILEGMGDFIVDNPTYEEIIDEMAIIQSKRVSEIAAADTHYARGVQNLNHKNFELAIKHLGQCVVPYQKEQTRRDLVQTCGMLAMAYKGLDLLYAAHVMLVKALSLLFHQWHVEGTLNHLAITILDEICHIQLRLGRFVCFLNWARGMSLIVNNVQFDGYDDNEKALMIDAVCATALLNADASQESFEKLPAIIERFGLNVSYDIILYKLGYSELVSEEFRNTIMAEDDWEEKLRSKSNEVNLLFPLHLDTKRQSILETVIKGCRITVNTNSSYTSVVYAEQVLAMFEAMLSTMQMQEMIPSTPTVHIKMKVQTGGKNEVKKGDKSNQYILKINTSSIDGKSLWELSINLLSLYLAQNAVMKDFKSLLEKKEKEEGIGNRIATLNSHISETQNALQYDYLAYVDKWVEQDDKFYPNKNMHEETTNVNYQSRQNGMIITDLIDYPLWDKAKWSGCGYMLDRYMEEPPIMILLFRSISYGKKIFEKWEEDYKQSKLNIKVTIITGVDKKHPMWYKVLISPDISKYPIKENNGRYVVAASRFHLMQAKDDANIRLLRRMYGIHHFIGLSAAAITSDNQMQLSGDNRYPRVIPVQNINFREAWTIGENDVDSMAILASDNPVIPEEHKDDAPIIDLLKKKSAYGHS